MSKDTADSDRLERLRRMWPNEIANAESPRTCMSIDVDLSDWEELLSEDDPLYLSKGETGIFGAFFSYFQKSSVDMLSRVPFELGDLKEKLQEIRDSVKPLGLAHFHHTTVIFGSAEAKFNSLVGTWRRETLNISDVSAILMHPSYYAIIGMGREALPYIFMDLEKGGGHWFVALRAITQEDPVGPGSAHNARRMREDWLAWGRAHGYIRS